MDCRNEVRDLGHRERDFQRQVTDLARLYHWSWYHTYRSDRSPAGFPDLVLIRAERLVFAELKSADGQLTHMQQAWLDSLQRIKGIEVYLWRPADLEEIEEILR